MALTNLWGSFFSRIEKDGAMVRPFRRGWRVCWRGVRRRMYPHLWDSQKSQMRLGCSFEFTAPVLLERG